MHWVQCGVCDHGQIGLIQCGSGMKQQEAWCGRHSVHDGTDVEVAKKFLIGLKSKMTKNYHYYSLKNVITTKQHSPALIQFGSGMKRQRAWCSEHSVHDDTDVEVARRFCHSYIQQSTTMSETVVKDVIVPVLLKSKKCVRIPHDMSVTNWEKESSLLVLLKQGTEHYVYQNTVQDNITLLGISCFQFWVALFV